MPVEQIIRAVAIDDLAICIKAWRWICDDCGRRDTFPDSPMPEGCSELAPQQKGWRIRWDAASDGELCRCPQCSARNYKAVAAKLKKTTDTPLCAQAGG
jgi:hypothetical protein